MIILKAQSGYNAKLRLQWDFFWKYSNSWKNTACGKTYFTQKLALNNIFGELKKVEWVSYRQLNSEREAEIESCFSFPVEFHYPKELEKFNDLLELLKLA